MASWNNITEGAELSKCPVCLCNLAKKKLERHKHDCYLDKKPQMESLGVIQCPFDSFHILPITYLNHHLDGNCNAVANLLRKFYQKEDMKFSGFKGAPADYDPGIPDKYLNKQNKDLLYLLNQDLYGDFVADHERQQGEQEAEPSTSQSSESRPMATEPTELNPDDIE